MNANKKLKVPQPPKKKINLLLIFILLIVVGFVLNTLSFFGPTLLTDLSPFRKPKLSDDQIDKLINPVEPRGYQYPSPAVEAVNRVINCNQVYSFTEFPRNNPLCLNLFQTSPQDITQKLTSSNDRIILYGQRSVFDAPTSSNITKDYIKDLYQNVKFMDQIALPKMLSAYGLADVSYSLTKPYPYLYYRISNLDESDEICHYGDNSEKIRGCARGFFASIIPLAAVGPQLSAASPVMRTSDKARFSYLTHYPADCFANDVFIHETSHLLNDASQGTTGFYVMDSWFNEQIAGYFEIYGAEAVCGNGTVVLQNKPEVKDIPKALAQFNSVFPPADLSHDYPKDNTCRQALLTEWYRYLGKGDLKTNFKRFFTEQRATVKSFYPDSILANFLLSLDNSPEARNLLNSKGCSL